MGKDKLRKFAEITALENVIEPDINAALQGSDLKGRWLQDIFPISRPLTLELGCGKGEYTLGQAERYPERNFLGVDIKGARIWRGAKTAHEAGMDNVMFLRTRIDFITSFFGKDEISEIWITFPDPQPQRNRRKKRLTHPLFLERYRSFLQPDGWVNLKTDDRFFYEYSLAVAQTNGFEIAHAETDIYNGPIDHLPVDLADLLRLKTYYEQRWLKEGKAINYLRFKIGSGPMQEPEEPELNA